MTKTKNTFNLLLTFFTIIIFIMFFYLYSLFNSLKNYNSYKKSFNSLIYIDQSLNTFLDKKDKFVNFDLPMNNINNFGKTLDLLLQKNLKKEFGDDFYESVLGMSSAYEKKVELIERFKSRQSTNLNSIHYIYELNQEFIKSKKIKDELKILINSTLFMLMQNFIDLNDNKTYILKNIKLIKKKNKKLDLRSLEFLYIHLEKILENIDYMKKINIDAKSLNIKLKLEKINTQLINKHEEQLFYQILISLFFFISIIVVTFMIYRENRKSSKIKNELFAFKYAVEKSDNSVVLTDANRNILYVNDNFEKKTGFLKSEIEGLNPRVLGSKQTTDETHKELNEKLDAGEKWEGELINKRKDGTLFYEKASILPIIIDNELRNYLAIKLDITKYIEQSETIKLSSIAFNNIQEGVLICDVDKTIITVNEAFEVITGYRKEELIGKKPNIFKSNMHDKIYYERMWNELNEKGRWKGKIYNKRKNGEIVPIWLNISVVKDSNNKITKYVAVHTSLKEIIDSQEKANFLAYHDSLTKLPNRVKLEENLEYSISFAARNNSNLFVLFIDLDRFKNINDTLGHGIGDKLLVIVANRIRKVLRETDTLARMGGDEFIVVLDSSVNKKSAGYVCEKILDVIKELITIDNNTLTTSGSIGVAMYPDDGKDITTLIKNADTAMYHAKKLGKDTYQYYDKQLSLDVHEQLNIEQALKDVIEKEELFLNYQAQYELKTKKVIAFEALVRWEHPQLGFISPEKFIAIAELTGDIIEIGKFIFETACRDFTEFKKINKELKYIAINISSIQFRDKNFVNDIFYIISKLGLDPQEIEIEITERHIIEFSENNMETINNLRELGFRFSIDDFGTGYSSLSYLTKLPIDVIKVDKSFIDGTPNDNNNVQISKAIVALSKSLGYKVIAEGIEYIEQEEYLKTLDCELGQGFLFSKPLSFDNAVAFLKK
ncbi:MAG: EAL domain-containing protein [Halarcobacter sp.]